MEFKRDSDGAHAELQALRYAAMLSVCDFSDLVQPDTPAQTVIADKAYDAQARLIEPLWAKGKAVVIPSRATNRQHREYDRDLYKARHLIENFFARLKQYRAIATRYDKTGRNFLGAIHLAASIVWLA